MQFCKILFVDCICKYSVAQKAFLAHPTAMKHLIDLTTLKIALKERNLHLMPIIYTNISL